MPLSRISTFHRVLKLRLQNLNVVINIFTKSLKMQCQTFGPLEMRRVDERTWRKQFVVVCTSPGHRYHCSAVYEGVEKLLREIIVAKGVFESQIEPVFIAETFQTSQSFYPAYCFSRRTRLSTPSVDVDADVLLWVTQIKDVLSMTTVAAVTTAAKPSTDTQISYLHLSHILHSL